MSSKNHKPLRRSLFSDESLYLKAEQAILDVFDKTSQREIPLNIIYDEVQKEVGDSFLVDFEHIVEVYLRHTPSTFLIDGENLKSLRPQNAGMPVVPPDTLYFGTTSSVASQALVHGLRSLRGQCVIVTADREVAVSRATLFAKECATEPCLITIDASRAFKEFAVIFQMGDRDNLYKAEYIGALFLSVETLQGG